MDAKGLRKITAAATGVVKVAQRNGWPEHDLAFVAARGALVLAQELETKYVIVQRLVDACRQQLATADYDGMLAGRERLQDAIQFAREHERTQAVIPF